MLSCALRVKVAIALGAFSRKIALPLTSFDVLSCVQDLARGAFYVREEQISELRLPRAWEKVEVWVYVKDPSTIKVVSE